MVNIIDDKEGYAFGPGYLAIWLVTTKLCPLGSNYT